MSIEKTALTKSPEVQNTPEHLVPLAGLEAAKTQAAMIAAERLVPSSQAVRDLPVCNFSGTVPEAQIKNCRLPGTDSAPPSSDSSQDSSVLAALKKFFTPKNNNVGVGPMD